MISTKNVKTGGESSISKTLSPGNAVIKVNSIKLEATPYNSAAYNIHLECEGPALGDGFEGFLIDKNDESKGRYEGQIGRIRMSEYAYSDGTTPTGKVIVRDEQILKSILTFCKSTECYDWFEKQDEKHDTIQSLVDQLNQDKPFAGKYLRVCIAGKEYMNKAGYPAYDLYFPKYSKDGVAYESASVDEARSKVVRYNPDVHIKKAKTTEVASFDVKDSSGSMADDFQL